MASFIDTLVLVFGLFFYVFTGIVFLLRANEKSDQELRLKYVFSIQLIPFSILMLLNLYQNQVRNAITLIPMIMFLGYDYWYRVHTEMKPLHHPDKWPRELIIYLVLLYAGGIGLNWYGFLVSERYGMMLVVGFFVMVGAYSYYQYKHNERKRM